jgi:hypothetical protein
MLSKIGIFDDITIPNLLKKKLTITDRNSDLKLPLESKKAVLKVAEYLWLQVPESSEAFSYFFCRR